MGYGKLGLVHIQMQDLRLKWAILIGRAKNKTSGSYTYHNLFIAGYTGPSRELPPDWPPHRADAWSEGSLKGQGKRGGCIRSRQGSSCENRGQG
jgi:hypothetical protein